MFIEPNMQRYKNNLQPRVFTQLLLSARLSHRNSLRSSVRLSVCLSHEWISQKLCKLESPNFHRRLPGKLQFQKP